MRTLFLVATLLFATVAHADCVCRCVGGKVRPICTSSLDLPPICPIDLCPLAPPSIAPLPSLQLPPIGTSQCRQVQVLNPVTQQYEWRTLCQ